MLDWGLGVPGAFLWMVASGSATYLAVAALDRPRRADAPAGAADRREGGGLEGV